MEKKLKITNFRQFETLVSELEKRPSLAKGFRRGANPRNFKQDWEEIAIKLNSIGPPIRDSEGWQKVWRDLKFKVKKKVQTNEAMSETGGAKLRLLPLEEAVDNLLQFKYQPIIEDELSIMPSDMEVKTEDVCVSDDDEEDLHSRLANAIHEQQLYANSNRKKRRQSQKRKNEDRQELLEKVFSEISYTMVEVRNLLKEASRYQQKLCEVEEKKFKILKRRHEREDELFETEMKLKKLKLELKTKELQILEKQCEI